MTPITLDFETFWTTDYSLSKLSFIEYIKSPLFETISVAIKVGSKPTQCYFGEETVSEALRAIDWANSAAIAHNGNEFDFPLLVWKYDCHPKLFIDTLCLSRPKHLAGVGGALSKLSKFYDLPEKNSSALLATKGKRYIEFTLDEVVAMNAYNKGDVDNTYELFKRFKNGDTEGIEDVRELSSILVWQKRELLLSDMTARMICYPQFECDVPLVRKTLKEVEDAKSDQLDKLIDMLGLLDEEEVRMTLSSSRKFATVLKDLFGIDAPTKISKTTGNQTLAMAKNDPEFVELLEHENPDVQALAAARIGVKSTILETRLQRLDTCAELMDGKLPVPLAYHAATTGRWGGRVWNPQNLPRIPRDKEGNVIPKSSNALRMSLKAPKGHKVVAVDLSNIELRVNHYIWGVPSTQKLFEKDPKADLYKTFAASMYRKPESEVTKDERQLAKVAQLGLGFGAGAETFKRVAKNMGGIDLTDDETLKVVQKWRHEYSHIVQGWGFCGYAVTAMFNEATFYLGPHNLVRTASNYSLLLPSGRRIYYPDLRKVTAHGGSGFVYGTGRHQSKVYGGIVDENIVQAIARDVVADHALTVWKETGRYPALTVHDELVYVVPENEAESFLILVNGVMRKAPSWMPGIVLWSEGDIADNYGEAK